MYGHTSSLAFLYSRNPLPFYKVTGECFKYIKKWGEGNVSKSHVCSTHVFLDCKLGTDGTLRVT